MSDALGAVKHALVTIHEALCMNSYEMRGSLTCQEAEAMYAAYLALDLHDMAEHFMTAHAHSDNDESDMHRVVHIDDFNTGWRYATDEERGE
jgi:hypothetical protein